MTKLAIKPNIDAALTTVFGYSTRLRGRGTPPATTVLRPGGVLGKRCLICMGSVDEGGEFILCPRCLNVYHLDCVMALGEEPVCPQCGRPLRDVVGIARVVRSG